MQPNDNVQEQLKQSLKKVFLEQDLSAQQQLIKIWSEELGVSTIDCAAGLLMLIQQQAKPATQTVQPEANKKPETPPVAPHFKLVRYRLDVGQIHKVSEQQIKATLIDISGVDKNSIGRLEIRNHYTLVDLPDGMPADIFQLLTEARINDQALSVKRVKFQRKYKRRNRKNQAS